MSGALGTRGPPLGACTLLLKRRHPYKQTLVREADMLKSIISKANFKGLLLCMIGPYILLEWILAQRLIIKVHMSLSVTLSHYESTHVSLCKVMTQHEGTGPLDLVR